MRGQSEVREHSAHGDELDEIRSACAYVAERASWVFIDADRLATYARELPVREMLNHGIATPFDRIGADPETLCAFVLSLDAVNFGSGYFPELRKLPNKSGYGTIETRLIEHFVRRGPLTAARLREASATFCAELFGQELRPPVDELMALFARAWRELGARVEDGFGGKFAALVDAAGGSAAALVRILIRLPSFQDRAEYAGRVVPFYKRAQIAAADLDAAFRGHAPGRFDDLDRLTLFADNLVPHVLKLDGVLRFHPALDARIEAGALIGAGSPEEVEIRACALHAVELISEHLRSDRETPVWPHQLDSWLWRRGGGAIYKARPRHRAHSTFY